MENHKLFKNYNISNSEIKDEASREIKKILSTELKWILLGIYQTKKLLYGKRNDYGKMKR